MPKFRVKGPIRLHNLQHNQALHRGGNLFLRCPQRSCFYTCLSVILFTGGMSVGQTPPPPGQTPWADTPLDIQTPQQTATAADGTHPTGMYSCSHIMLNYVKKIKGAAHKAVTLMVDVNRPAGVHSGVSTKSPSCYRPQGKRTSGTNI